MKVSKKRTAVAMELRDIGMRLVKEARTTTVMGGQAIQIEKATFLNGEVRYLRGRPAMNLITTYTYLFAR